MHIRRMISKITAVLSALTAIVITVGSFALPTFANEDISQTVSSILEYRFGGHDSETLQKAADTDLPKGAGTDSEWYAMSLSQYCDIDLSAYSEALEKYLSENEIASATSREKYALSLIAAGKDSPYITEALCSSVGEQGIMSYVFGLHILNNGFTAEGVTAESVASEILAMQLSDGGWAVMGEFGDIDVTAMTLQALAPLCGSNSEVNSACERAVQLLSEKQLESGGFMTMGAENSESCSQVICALSALGIDCTSDERFIKNGNSPIDALLSYKGEDGSFSHVSGEEANETATVEAFYSLVSYLRMKGGSTPLYVFDSVQESPSPKPAEGSTQAESKAESKSISEADSTAEKGGIGYKPIAIGAVLFVGTGAAIVLLILKKRSWKNFVFIAIIAGGLCAAIAFTEIKTEKEYYSESSSKTTAVTGTVTMSIRCDTIAGEGGAIPDDGTVLTKSEYELHEGESVYDILLSACKENNIRLDTKGTKNIYISGIGQIYEFDFGELSGWVYHVNGESASVGCSSYELKDGDSIEWLYTRNIEKDL